MQLVIVILSLALVMPSWGENNLSCNQVATRDGRVEAASRLSHEVAKSIEEASPDRKKARGYAILIGGVVGSAALATFVTAKLPEEAKFLTMILAQISALGIYDWFAPIRDPNSASVRKMAFGIENGRDASKNSPRLNALWRRLQEIYSLNEQMAKNDVNQFISSTRQNFYSAQAAMISNNRRFAADQIAEAARRMRQLFEEIEADDEDVKVAVRSAFTRHVVIDSAFRELVEEMLTDHVPNWRLDPEEKNFYLNLFTHWL